MLMLAQMQEFLKLLDDRGLAVFIVVVAVFAAWRGMVFFAPKVTAVTESHIRFVDTIEKQSEKQTDLMAQQNTILGEHTGMLKTIHEHVVRK